MRIDGDIFMGASSFGMIMCEMSGEPDVQL